MKLLVCDVEGTIFQPHKIKSAQHASYIWTAIAEALGKDAEREEINTQKKWRDGGYGSRQDGRAYINWVNDTIGIHVKYKLIEKQFFQLIDQAPYIDGVVDFFKHLDRNEYIPILISGGIQNLNERACRELGIDPDNSYAACKYFFNGKGQIEADLTFSNTCNFYGKQELVKIALRKYGLRNSDWVFIGDGINDVSVAEWAATQNAVSVGISPVDDLKKAVTYSYDSFSNMMADSNLMDKMGFFSRELVTQSPENHTKDEIKLAQDRVEKQIGRFHLDDLEERAKWRITNVVQSAAPLNLRRFSGIQKLLEQGELSFALTSNAVGQAPIVSALLQPFTNAAEIMVYVCLALTEDKKYLKNLLNFDITLRKHRERIENPDLQKVMREYFNNRNISAHSCREIPIEAAQTFIRRTYEIIQRLELIINSDC